MGNIKRKYYSRNGYRNRFWIIYCKQKKNYCLRIIKIIKLSHKILNNKIRHYSRLGYRNKILIKDWKQKCKILLWDQKQI